MALFTITVGSYTNQPPSQIGSFDIEIQYPDTYAFQSSNFVEDTTPPYSDPENDSASKIKIKSLPPSGILTLNGNAVVENQEIDILDIPNLVYTPDNTMSDGNVELFTFDVADTGSSTFSGLTGTITVTVLKAINLPPTEVGDGEATIEYGETLVFNRLMFTSQTTPPYSDPEGDAAFDLKVLALPNDGVLKLNGNIVIINQIINFSDIDNGLFTYEPDLTDTDGDLESFRFSIADEGSKIFVE